MRTGYTDRTSSVPLARPPALSSFPEAPEPRDPESFLALLVCAGPSRRAEHPSVEILR